MTAFATVQEFANFMQSTVTNSAATLALDAATSRIQDECEQLFTLVADDDITLPGGDADLVLPQWPVLSVESVFTTDWGDGVPVTQALGTSWSRRGAVLTWLGSGTRASGPKPAWPYVLRTVWPHDVRVVYTHGFATIPANIKMCCLKLAAESYTSPDGTHYESIDDYAWRRGDTASTPAAIELEKLRKRYRQSVYSVRATR